jgi:HD-GYP domain-containing protein (c-di-GMP phosphodiesterase class II)
MVSERPYAKSVPTADALAELRRCAGTQFDSTVVEALCDLVVERDQPALSIAVY